MCRQFRVRRLAAFGSALGDSFNEKASDLDLLVELENRDASTYANAYFELKDALDVLFGRPVDLVVESAIRNPYFRAELERSQELLYAA